MRNYWSCTKFADWLRGTAKISAGTSKEWDEWHTMAKIKHNFRYWLAEEGLDYIQNIWCYIPERLNDIRYYINNRWITRAHALTAHSRDIKPGDWCDVGNRFLPCLFNELVNFVEVEQAWHHCAWDDETRKKFNPPWWRRGWLRLRTWRCPEAGLAYLEWAAKLTYDQGLYQGKPSLQAETAQEILFLYKWWTETYRNRPDAYEASGFSAFSKSQEAKHGGFLSSINAALTKEELEERSRVMLLSQEIEQEYERENEEMMIRLIRIRQGLWT